MSIYYDSTDPFILEIREWFIKNPITKEELLSGLEHIPGTGWFKGYKHTEESRSKMREKASVPRKPHSETRKKNIGLAHKGRVLTEDHKNKIGRSLLGNLSWTGKNHSSFTKNKMKESHSKPVCCEGRYYVSVNEAASSLNITDGGVRYRIKVRQDYNYI
jgi:hypothetical protein